MSATFRITVPTRQTGIALIEALVSILIFSVGVLAIIGLMTASVVSLRDSTNRSQAGLAANQIIGQMWADDHDFATSLQPKYAGIGGAGGAQYMNWYNSSAVQALPGVANYPPTITVVAASAVTVPPSTIVTVQVYWKPPNATTTHNYSTVAQIN